MEIDDETKYDQEWYPGADEVIEVNMGTGEIYDNSTTSTTHGKGNIEYKNDGNAKTIFDGFVTLAIWAIALALYAYIMGKDFSAQSFYQALAGQDLSPFPIAEFQSKFNAITESWPSWLSPVSGLAHLMVMIAYTVGFGVKLLIAITAYFA